jgi:hypothetical protein
LNHYYDFSHNGEGLQRISHMRTVVIMLATSALLLGVDAMAQESRSEISLQGTGFFSTDTAGQSTTERTTNTGGFLVGYRYNLTRWLAGEAVYGYDRNTQHYFGTSGLSRIQANVHQATGGFVVRIPTSARFRVSPCVLAEGGALLFDPTGNNMATIPGAQRQATGVFAYGGGADFPLLRHVACVLNTEASSIVHLILDCQLSTPIQSPYCPAIGRNRAPVLSAGCLADRFLRSARQLSLVCGQNYAAHHDAFGLVGLAHLPGDAVFTERLAG